MDKGKDHRYLSVWGQQALGCLYAAPIASAISVPLIPRPLFEALGKERCAQITHVSADAASWISNVVAKHCPNAVRCMDPFHVVASATDALDQVRREVWNAARDRSQNAQVRAEVPSGHP